MEGTWLEPVFFMAENPTDREERVLTGAIGSETFRRLTDAIRRTSSFMIQGWKSDIKHFFGMSVDEIWE
jgi:hypothetical protein